MFNRPKITVTERDKDGKESDTVHKFWTKRARNKAYFKWIEQHIASSKPGTKGTLIVNGEIVKEYEFPAAEESVK